MVWFMGIGGDKMIPGMLVSLIMKKTSPPQEPRYGLFLGYGNDNGYVYSNVLWFGTDKPATVQNSLIEVLDE